MRAIRLIALVSVIVATACAAATPPHLDRIRFSDSVATAASDQDTTDLRFELSRVQFVHAHLDASYVPGWTSRVVDIACVVSGPKADETRRVTLEDHLPRGQTQVSWRVPLATADGGPWREGRYHVRCEASGSGAIESAFDIVDTAPLVKAPATAEPSIFDVIQQLTPPAATWPRPATSPSANASSTSPWSSVFDHTHPASTPAERPAVAPSVVATLTIHAATEALGAEGPAADRFDAETTTFVSYRLGIEGSGDGAVWSLNDCQFIRALTGVRLPAGTSTTLDWKGNRVTRRGTAGGQFAGQWLPGEYRVECAAVGVSIPARTFIVAGEPVGDPRVTQTAGRLGFAESRVKSLEFIEYGHTVPGLAERRYFGWINGAPRYIGAESVFTFKASDTPRSYTYTCHYFTAAGALIGRARTVDALPPGVTERNIVTGWGNAAGSFWRAGKYFVECDADGLVIGSRFFDVRR